MIRIHRTVEYALIALKHLRDADTDAIVSAKELSDRYRLPYDLVSKVLQKLTSVDILASQQGVRGGYRLGTRAPGLTFLELSNLLVGPPGGARCTPVEHGLAERYSCDTYSTCTIVAPIADLGRQIETLFQNILVLDLLDSGKPAVCCRG